MQVLFNFLFGKFNRKITKRTILSCKKMKKGRCAPFININF